MRFTQPQISQYIVKQLKTQINQLIDRERVIPEQKMAELKKCLSYSIANDCGKKSDDIIPAFFLQIRAPLQQ